MAQLYIDPSFPEVVNVDNPTAYAYVGCYSPGPDTTPLSFTPDNTNLDTQEACFDACATFNFPFASFGAGTGT